MSKFNEKVVKDRSKFGGKVVKNGIKVVKIWLIFWKKVWKNW